MKGGWRQPPPTATAKLRVPRGRRRRCPPTRSTTSSSSPVRAGSSRRGSIRTSGPLLGSSAGSLLRGVRRLADVDPAATAALGRAVLDPETTGTTTASPTSPSRRTRSPPSTTCAAGRRLPYKVVPHDSWRGVGSRAARKPGRADLRAGPLPLHRGSDPGRPGNAVGADIADACDNCKNMAGHPEEDWIDWTSSDARDADLGGNSVLQTEVDSPS